jgi:hypothetical protein
VPSATKTKKKAKPASPKANGHATITKSQAERLVEAEAAVRRAEATLESAERERREIRERLISKVPLSRDEAERTKKIRTAIVGGITIRVTPSQTGERFSLRRFREAGHEITPEMRKAITPGKTYERWTVKAHEQ